MSLAAITAMIPAGLFKRVAGLDALAKLSKEPALAMPSCFVVPDSETGVPPTEGSYILHQVLNTTVAIVICTHPDGARAGAANAELAELEEAVLAALYGKQPEGWDSGLTIADIRTAQISPAMVARVIRMRGRRSRRVQITP